MGLASDRGLVVKYGSSEGREYLSHTQSLIDEEYHNH